MELRINRETTIKDIQNEFSHFYPYLKIEFFRNRPQEIKSSRKAEKIDPGERASNLTKSDESADVNIDGNRTVGELVQDFENIFGLSTQVFRKSGNLWIETSLTADWSLDKQNKEGKLLNSPDRKSLDQQIEDYQVDSD